MPVPGLRRGRRRRDPALHAERAERADPGRRRELGTVQSLPPERRIRVRAQPRGLRRAGQRLRRRDRRGTRRRQRRGRAQRDRLVRGHRRRLRRQRSRQLPRQSGDLRRRRQ